MPGWPSELAPGETGSFETKFNTTGKRGHQSKSITVTTSDPTQPRFVYRLEGDIYEPIEVNPSGISLRAKIGEVVTKNAQIKNNTDEVVILADIEYPDDSTAEMMTLTLSNNRLEPGGSADLALVFNAKAEGRTFKNFAIKTDSKEAPQLNLRVSAYVDDPSQVPNIPQTPVNAPKSASPGDKGKGHGHSGQ